jgi:hypothetical protein
MSTIDPTGQLRILPLPSPASPLPLRPIPRSYDPGYPAALTGEQIQQLLRPGLFRRFSRPTLIAGTVIAGALAAGGCGQAPAPVTVDARQPAKGVRTSQGARRQAEIDRLVAEILGPYEENRFWNRSSSLASATEISGNPPVKYPHIPISFGNSYIGVFDTAAARAATLKLFAAYGLQLVPGVTVKGEGYQFVADGFDRQSHVGFKIILPVGEGRAGDVGFSEQDPAHDLGEDELKPLDASVKAGEVQVFIARAEGFPNMDGDLYTPMEYYLASVIDYLSWIHGDRQIDPGQVLGRTLAAPPARGR